MDNTPTYPRIDVKATGENIHRLRCEHGYSVEWNERDHNTDDLNDSNNK